MSTKTVHGTNKFGWCLTGHHHLCAIEIRTRVCGCPCHEDDSPEWTLS